MRLLAVVMVVACTPLIAGQNSFRIGAPFSDNMVLQQQTHAAIWGYGIPFEEVFVRPSWGKETRANVGNDGYWSVRLKTPKAGGPYTVTIRHQDSTLVLRNILVGEVWLCSGQSNMEMPLEGWPPSDTILHSKAEIAKATYPNLRLLSVGRQFSPSSESMCEGSWVECTPHTAARFSATAFFFGKALAHELKIPIGLVVASWGGTPVEAWTSAEYLSRVPAYTASVQKVIQCRDSMGALLQWLSGFPVISMKGRTGDTRWEGLSFNDAGCESVSWDDNAWSEMQLPTTWEQTELGEFDGAVWFRKSVKIPGDWLHRELTLKLGPIDDMDVTYVNGGEIGSHEREGMWQAERVYRIPATLITDSVVHIAVRVVDFQGGGGLFGKPDQLLIEANGMPGSVTLAGVWKFLPVAEFRGQRFFVFGSGSGTYASRTKLPMNLSASSPTVLYNGMIAPLVPYAIRGAIWYQGEANTGNPAEYRTVFPLMIENWRDAFHQADLPFLYVQIAPWDYGPKTESAYLREAQFVSLSTPNTGMAVTLDIGEAKNIHPPNKEEVGNRLALWAKAKVYGKKVVYSGPLYRSMKREGSALILSFEYTDGGLVLKGEKGSRGFQIAGEDSIFRDASVTLRGNQLVVSHPAIVKPLAVRYAFSNTPEASLFNRAGLPATSFRTDSWPVR